MLSKNKAKFIKKLQLKKYREAHGCFTVEGKKSVLELTNSQFQVQTIVCTEPFWLENKNHFKGKNFEMILCSDSELESVSSFKTNNSVLAVAKTQPNIVPNKVPGLTLVLDGINDPGNMGSLIRIADWFGIRTIIASLETTDLYNPKVLQSSMGSFCRVGVHYVKLEQYLQSVRLPIYAASMKGEPVHDFTFEKECILLLGNESHGISPLLMKYVSKTIGIPEYGEAESLNVSIAAAIICDNYCRLKG